MLIADGWFSVDIIVDYYHGTQLGLPALSGQLGATYAIPIIYVPVLMITHVVAFYLLFRPQPNTARAAVRASQSTILPGESL